MKSLTWPAPLKPGDKVALTAPSSPVPAKNLEAAVKSIEFLNLKPVIMPSCHMSHGYMAGPDKQRADDINMSFANRDVKGVFCLRGGYGISRILPLLDFDIIRQNPKTFIGYSDVTALHTAINNLCGFVTFHGPMPNTDYRKLDEFTIDRLKTALFTPADFKTINNPVGEQIKLLQRGDNKSNIAATDISGRLTGGNLSLLVATLGSPYEVDTEGRILFIEDVGERPYRLDKALTALSLAGKFRDCRGIILGTFPECEEPAADKVPRNTVIARETLTLDEIFAEVILPWNKPTLLNLRVGHIYPQSTLPMGAALTLDLGDTSAISISLA